MDEQHQQQTMLGECKDFKHRVEKFIEEFALETTGKGGYRERLLMLEIEVRVLKKDVLKGSIIGGIIGALIGSGAAPAISALINFIIKVG